MPNFHKITVWHEIFAGVYFCGSLEKPQKLEPAKISFHTLHAKVLYQYE